MDHHSSEILSTITYRLVSFIIFNAGQYLNTTEGNPLERETLIKDKVAG